MSKHPRVEEIRHESIVALVRQYRSIRPDLKPLLGRLLATSRALRHEYDSTIATRLVLDLMQLMDAVEEGQASNVR